MDKLELDARVARLERRVAFLLTAFLLAAAAGVFLIYVARHDSQTGATVIAAPLPPPTPTAEWVEPPVAADPFMGDMSMMGMMGAAGGTMGALFHELTTMKQLRDEGIISEEEWEAKKARILEEELHPGDLRSDLQLVQQLSDSGAICEEERGALRARLLGIDEAEAGEKQDH